MVCILRSNPGLKVWDHPWWVLHNFSKVIMKGALKQFKIATLSNTELRTVLGNRKITDESINLEAFYRTYFSLLIFCNETQRANRQRVIFDA